MNSLKQYKLEISYFEKELPNLILEIKKLIFPGVIIALSGPMGSGKTTLARSLIQSLGVKDVISSPTYSYLNRYKASFNNKEIMINHTDLYRVDNYNLENLGITDYFFSGLDISIIEWPDILNLKYKNNKSVLYLNIDYIDKEKRKIVISNYE